MKTLKLSIIGLLLIILAIPFQSCKVQFNSDRVNYDFYKKQITSKDSNQVSYRRPLVIKENKEIQIEISNFNPLKYAILIHDSSYNRFDPNIETFSRYIVVPDIKEVPNEQSLVPPTEGKKIDKGMPDRNQLDSLKTSPCSGLASTIKLKEKNLQKYMVEYKNYLKYIELINSYYKYLQSLEKLPDSIIIANGITSNILLPVGNISGRTLVSPDKVFESDFYNIEYKYFESIKKIEEEATEIASHFDDIIYINCNQINELARVIKKMTLDIHKFDSIRMHKILPEFAKTMMVYGKLQNLIQDEPIYVSKSTPIINDVQYIKIFKFNHVTGIKELHDEIRIHLTAGFRLNVSSGFFFSDLYDSKYKIFSKDSIYTYNVLKNDTIIDTTAVGRFVSFIEDSGEKLSYGGMVFFHGHSENATMINYGLYIGVGAIFNDQTRWAASGGFSLIIGTSQRLFLNLGCVIAQVDRLQNPYKKDTFYLTQLENVPISRVWKNSWMIGASWKIGKK